jgi:hypothetical protein
MANVSNLYLEILLTHYRINLPSLKSLSFLRVLSTGNISCPALGEAFASLTFHPKKNDPYTGFTCWTGYENNSWNSSDPDHNPTTGGSSPTPTGSGSNSATNTKYGSSIPKLIPLRTDNKSRIRAANAALVGYVAVLLFSAGVLCF